MCGAGEIRHGTQHHAPGEQPRQRQKGQQRNHDHHQQLSLRRLQVRVHRRQRKLDVEHTEHAHTGRVGVTGGLRAAGFVVKRRNDTEDALAGCRLEHPCPVVSFDSLERASGTMTLHTLLGVAVDERAHFLFFRRNGDLATGIEHTDSLECLLVRNRLDDAANLARVVAHHGLTGGAPDHLGNFRGAVFDHLHQM